MGAKITVAGEVQKIRIMKNPWNPQVNLNCLDVVTAGSPASPKGLPPASKISYTILVNDRSYNKLVADLKEFDLKLKGTKIFVQGEITLDQPLNIVEGEIGVIAFNIESPDVKRLKAAAEQAAENPGETHE